MPNWCTTNIFVSGGQKEVQDFADTVNALRGKKHVIENGFGDYWLGNLAVTLGLVTPDEKSIYAFPGNLRGVIDPNPDAEPCWFIGKPEEDNDEDTLHLEVIENSISKAILWFSVTCAYSKPAWLLE